MAPFLHGRLLWINWVKHMIFAQWLLTVIIVHQINIVSNFLWVLKQQPLRQQRQHQVHRHQVLVLQVLHRLQRLQSQQRQLRQLQQHRLQLVQQPQQRLQVNMSSSFSA